MVSEHTPGPWHIAVWAKHTESAGQPSSIYVEDDWGESNICHFDRTPDVGQDAQAANARLIAAAPELVEAVRLLLMVSLPTDVSGEAMVDKARRIYEKAIGRSGE